jgi:yecA family protein
MALGTKAMGFMCEFTVLLQFFVVPSTYYGTGGEKRPTRVFDHFQSLVGSFRAILGRSMKPKARYSARYGQAAPQLLPPDIQALGSIAFTRHEFAALDAWLAEDGWPTEHMDAAMLEGYLVALLAWPIQLSPGAWLPAIWGVRGWKVAAKIATPEHYDRFLALVVGLLQELERRLTATPRAPTFVLASDRALLSTRYFAGAAWSTGFISALQFNATGFGSRSALSRCALENIIAIASMRSKESSAMSRVAAELGASVATLMDERPARGASTRIARGTLVAA